MKNELLNSIFRYFEHDSEYDSFSVLASGHINDTYLVHTKSDNKFVLQRINHGVFKDVPGLISNKVLVSEYLRKKMSHLPEDQLQRNVLTFVKTKEGAFYHKDTEGNFWNLMIFIDNSQTFELVTDKEIAYEGGKLSGEFLNLTSDFDESKLIDVIPKFHDMSFRYWQFDEAMKTASDERKEKANDCIQKVEELREEMHIIQNLKDAGEIRTRVTHNDTKISNALFDMENKGLCVIDTDTVMPGIVHYDFGDAIRTICNTAAEDEKDLDKVTFNESFYHAYVKGFMEKVESSLTPAEIKYLPLGAKSMIFIMAIRFLTDFLNNDVYYKTIYAEHNLVRAKNQLKLIESFSEKITLN
ncbi:phosphotransferase enzyme family protein [Urechidicola vernalis]|uniref:Aminoglycoside phosphotransferase family protein n=1 Tax=Urechidicola vernalis TaxID=3075600 RepID=A0ABU2Y5B9_9FLAO|nr:aminoglycoside phosphotransferase family protein [Urechidicola sp. P050]MDT0552854.1 aminoglycoside phosphotransferase family protein [Urechidicola sp. P050]